jgi:hypothetical protein
VLGLGWLPDFLRWTVLDVMSCPRSQRKLEATAMALGVMVLAQCGGISTCLMAMGNGEGKQKYLGLGVESSACGRRQSGL